MSVDIPDSYDPEWLQDRLRDLSNLLDSNKIDKAKEMLEIIRSYCGY